MTLISLQFIIQTQDVIICSHVIVIHHLQIFIFIVPFQLFTDVFLSITSKLPGNWHSVIEQAKIIAFSYVRNFRSPLRVFSL